MSGVAWGYQAGFVGEDHELGAVAGVELSHGPVDVGFRGHRADHHAVGDLVVGQALRDQGDGLAFAVGQLFQPRVGAGGERLGDVPVDQLAGDRRCQQGVATGGDADGVQEVFRLDVLDEESGRAGAQRVEDVLVQAIVGQDHDVHPGQGRVGGDAPGRLDAVHDRHLNVDERNVGQVFFGQVQALAAVGGLGHHLDVVLDLEEGAESAAKERLVVDQPDTDHDGWS